MHLSSLCNTHARPVELQELTNPNLPVVVLGTGSQGIRVAEWLEKNSIPVKAFCETSAYYHPGKIVCGKPVYEYESLFSVFPHQNAAGGYGCHLVFAASGEGVLDMWKYPVKTVKKHYFNLKTPYVGEVKMTAEWVNEHMDTLDETYQLLADDASRNVFLSCINERAHCLKNPTPHLYQLYTADQYFNDLYDLDRYENHVLIDCGAYTGDTAEMFLAFLRAHGKMGRVLAFEPEAQKQIQIKATAEKLSITGMGEVECFPYAVGEKKGIITFATGLEGGSHCLEGNSNAKNIVQVPIVALDEILQDTEVSIIKMDIEGSELAALKGAKRIIAEQMPLLAICVYHRDDDLITIPQYIQQLVQKTGETYKFYLKHHSLYPLDIYETVLYAVPE